MIYFDNAATTLRKPECVIEAVAEAMRSMGNAGRGTHEASLGASRSIYNTRCLLSDFFHAGGPKQVAFTANSTESLNIAIKGLFHPGDHVITTVLEHNSVLRPLYELEAQGVEISFAGADRRSGLPDYEAFEKLIRKNTCGIVTTHGSNLTGNLVNLEWVGHIAREHGLLFIVDASQTAGIFPIDMQKLGIDVLCFTGHKSLLGPQGTGGMCVREGLAVRPLKSGGSGIHTYSRSHPADMPAALEAGTLNSHGIAGLHAAVEYIEKTGMENIRAKELSLMKRFYEGVRDIPGVHIYGDFTDMNRCPIVALNIRDDDSSKVSDELFMAGEIATRPGAHCAPLMHEALGTVSQGAVRFSFSHYNTEEEVDTAAAILEELACN